MRTDTNPEADGPGEIAYVVGRYPAVSHTFVQREVRALRRRGVSVATFSIHRAPPSEVLSAADREEFDRTYAVLPVEARDHLAAHLRAFGRSPSRYLGTLGRALGLSKGLRGRLWGAFYFCEAVVVWDQCRRRGISRLHVHFANQASDAAELACRLGGPGWSWSMTVHGPVEFFDVTRFRLADKVRDARFVACISDYCRTQVMGLVEPEHWDKLRLVHCGVDLEAYDPGLRLASGSGPVRVLTVGRMIGLKGMRLLVAAIAELAARGLDVEATMVGDGPERAALERLARDLGADARIRFPGYVGQDDLRQLFADADVFCLPSFAEGVPVVLMEAMAMEVPVVTTRITGIPELVDDGESGLLVVPGREDELVHALERLVRDPELRRAMGRAGRAKVLAEFDVDASAAALAAAFAGAPAPSPAAPVQPEVLTAGAGE
jgi:glycosyltransferase involved in cell wall biosynthesis